MSIEFSPTIDPQDGAPVACGFEVFGEGASTNPCKKPAVESISQADVQRIAEYTISKRTSWMVAGEHFCQSHADIIRLAAPFLPAPRCGATWNPGVWPYVTKCILDKDHAGECENFKGDSL